MAIIADAWGVSLVPPKGRKNAPPPDVHTLAKNLVMVAAVYLAVWGCTCMTIAHRGVRDAAASARVGGSALLLDGEGLDARRGSA